MIIDEGLGERTPAFVSTSVEALLIRPTCQTRTPYTVSFDCLSGLPFVFADAIA